LSSFDGVALWIYGFSWFMVFLVFGFLFFVSVSVSVSVWLVFWWIYGL